MAGTKLDVEVPAGDFTYHLLQSGAAPTKSAIKDKETVTLRIKPPVNADFDIESFSGDIENCFGQKARDTSKYTPGSELNFTQGKGGARVEIETLSGEISLCDR